MEMRVEVDVSKYAIAAVLKQKDESGKWQPCAFFSRQLTSAEKNYDVGEKGLVCAIKHWKYNLHGPFLVMIYHKNIVHYMAQEFKNSLMGYVFTRL